MQYSFTVHSKEHTTNPQTTNMKFIIAVVILGTVATASVAPILEVASRSTILNSPIISSQGTPSAFSTRQYLATEDAITFASHDQITPLESLPLSYASPLAYSGHFAAPLAYSSYAAPLARALPLGIQADGYVL